MSSLLSRAAVVIAVPLCGCLVLAVFLALEWRHDLAQAEEVATRAALEIDLGRLVNALQAERGASIAAAVGVEAFGDLLPEARAETDKVQGRARDLLGKAEPLAGALVAGSLLREQKETLSELRRRVDARDIGVLELMEGYTSVIRATLDESDAFAAMGQPIPDLAELADVYRRLLIYKERAARERGFGAALLGVQGESPKIREYYRRNRILHEEVRRELLDSTPGSLDRRMLERMAPSAEPQRLRELRERLDDSSRLVERDEKAALAWFEETGRQIEAQQRTLDELAREIHERASRLARHAQERFVLLLSSIVVAFAALLWLSRTLSKQLVTHLEAEQRHARRARYLASHDPMTELPNRVTFEEELEVERVRAAAERRVLALHVIDIEDFSRINRVWGNRTGDAVLIAVARRLAEVTKGRGRLGRLYGDQFGLVQPLRAGRDEAGELAREMLASFEPPVHFEERLVPVRARIGITLYPPDGETTEVLLRNADLARQHVAEGGRYVFYVAEMYETYLASRMLMDALRSADVAADFVVHYQPKVDTATSRVHGVEALVRWKRDGQLWSPGSFIREAEQSGAIVPIGLWVFTQACEQVKAWKALGLEPPVIAVNLSAVQLMQANLVDSLADVLEETGIDPHYLELEITESVLTEDLEDTSERLSALRKLGIALAIDDFGTGHSSFTYLRHFPVTTIKIDQSFVGELGQSAESEVIVDAVIQLARSLHLRVVAEGVETPQQLQMLREKACDEVQGHLLSRPLPAEDMTKLLRAQDRPAGGAHGHPAP